MHRALLKYLMIGLLFVLTYPGLSNAQSLMRPPEELYPATVEHMYAVQLGAYQDAAEAEALKADLAGEGYEPIHVLAEDDLAKVLVGRFALYVDAMLARDDIRETLAPDAFVRKFPFDDPELVDNNTIPGGSRYYPSFSVEGAPSLANHVAYQQLQAVDRTGTDEEYEVALNAALTSHDSTDPIRGYIFVNLGILEVKKGNLEAAFEYFEPVAWGDVPSVPAHRVMALRRCAWILHQQGDRIAAYRIYTELEEITRHERLRAICITERVGLLMELAESGKGTHQEMRWAKQQWKSKIPEGLVQERAVLDLMESESWARQPEPNNMWAVALGETLIHNYSQLGENAPMREISTAMWQTGMYYERLHATHKAIEYYQRTLDEIPDNVERFAGIHPKASALFRLSVIAERSGDHATAAEIRDEIIDRFPDTRTARNILERRQAAENDGAGEVQQ